MNKSVKEYHATLKGLTKFLKEKYSLKKAIEKDYAKDCRRMRKEDWESCYQLDSQLKYSRDLSKINEDIYCLEYTLHQHGQLGKSFRGRS